MVIWEKNIRNLEQVLIKILKNHFLPRHSFEDLFTCVKRKYDVDEKYDYHLKTSMVYFKDAEPEIDSRARWISWGICVVSS